MCTISRSRNFRALTERNPVRRLQMAKVSEFTTVTLNRGSDVSIYSAFQTFMFSSRIRVFLLMTSLLP